MTSSCSSVAESEASDALKSTSTAEDLCLEGDWVAARELLLQLISQHLDDKLRARVLSDLGVTDALNRNASGALSLWRDALRFDPNFEDPKVNGFFVRRHGHQYRGASPAGPIHRMPSERIRIVIVSFLFNWPSTGGGTIHTVELAKFLSEAGYDVTHVFARHLPWGIGRCDEALHVPAVALDFDEQSWSLEGVQARFRTTIGEIHPDYVIVTDSWNSKPILAEAVSEFPYLLRYQALENLCPLNNVRLLTDSAGQVRQCFKHQLAQPGECWDCCQRNDHLTGTLHQVERAFSRVGTKEYDDRLRRVVRHAHAVLVVNPLTQAIFGAYNDNVQVVPAGMDPSRFPWPPPKLSETSASHKKGRILFAGLTQEWMKGFHVLIAACDELWRNRQDFEVVATSDSWREERPYLHFLGWQSQEALVGELYRCDILAFPTIAQEALGRTAVEAMAAGKPVVASDIGGLSYTVIDERTGLLAKPSDPHDLAQQMGRLLEDQDFARRLGGQGRQVFSEKYSWPVIIDRHYRRLLTSKLAAPTGA